MKNVVLAALASVAIVLAGAAVGVALAGCGADQAASAGPAPTEVPSGAEPAPAPSAGTGEGEVTQPNVGVDGGGTRRYEVWLTQGDTLFQASREGAATEGVGAEALRLLLAGPTDEELAAGVSSQIPGGTRLLGLDIDDGVATVDLTSEFEAGGGSLSMQGRLAQVVYTLTQFETVQSVRFHLDGEPVDVFSGEGIILDEPVGRKDYETLLPAIVVASPGRGASVGSPVEVSGRANVFEANVTVRILDAAGNELARDFTTATCGTGCWGDFSLALAYRSPRAQQGTIVVSDDDADGDGSPQHEVRIPVTLGAAP